MLDSAGKLYEWMIFNHGQSELDDPKIEGLSEMQYGLRAGWSTLHVVQEVQKRVNKAFTMKPKPGDFCAVIILDMKNAFITANW